MDTAMKKELAKYFWSASGNGMEEIARSLADPAHPLFIQNSVTLLSRCDDPKEAFRIISRELFMEAWPKVRRWWKKSGISPDFLQWWDSVFAGLAKREVPVPRKGSSEFGAIGRRIREARLNKGWNQKDVAQYAGIAQRFVSEIERGVGNPTIETLLKICRVLGIEDLHLG